MVDLELVALLLTEFKPVETEPDLYRLGDSPTGDFVVNVYPALIDFGLLLDIGFNEEDHGHHEIDVVLDLPDDGLTSPVLRHTFELPPCDEDWWGLRIKRLVTNGNFGAAGPMDAHLDVECDGVYLGGRPLRVRQRPL